MAPRAYPGQRTGSFGPHRVRQNVGTLVLKEHGGVVHQSGSQSAACHTAGRDRLFDIRNEGGRRLPPAGELPAESLTKAGRLRSIRIVKAFSVKVLREGPADSDLRHAWQFTLRHPLWSGLRCAPAV
jgi:hypothetical protein